VWAFPARRDNNPARKGDSEGDAFAKARELQRGLYVAAKRQPETVCYSEVVHAARENHR